MDWDEYEHEGDKQDEYEYETFIVQDWCGNQGEIKNKTDILLSHDGKFIAFGYKALDQLCGLA